LDDRERHNAHSLAVLPFINENRGLLPCIAFASEGCRFLISPSVLQVSVSAYLPISPWDGAITACVALKVRESGLDNGLSKKTSAESFTLPKGFGTRSLPS